MTETEEIMEEIGSKIIKTAQKGLQEIIPAFKKRIKISKNLANETQAFVERAENFVRDLLNGNVIISQEKFSALKQAETLLNKNGGIEDIKEKTETFDELTAKEGTPKEIQDKLDQLAGLKDRIDELKNELEIKTEITTNSDPESALNLLCEKLIEINDNIDAIQSLTEIIQQILDDEPDATLRNKVTRLVEILNRSNGEITHDRIQIELSCG